MSTEKKKGGGSGFNSLNRFCWNEKSDGTITLGVTVPIVHIAASMKCIHLLVMVLIRL